MSRMKRGGIISYPNGVIPEMVFKKMKKKMRNKIKKVNTYDITMHIRTCMYKPS